MKPPRTCEVPAARSTHFFAHTATLSDGRPDDDESLWQPLAKHLRNVADVAEKFAVPFNLGAEAKLAGLLHDL